jgi:hypothetical protein
VRATAAYTAVLVVFVDLGRIPLGDILMAAGCFFKSIALKHPCARIWALDYGTNTLEQIERGE